MVKIKLLVDRGHGIDTKGKCSPDKSILEWKYTNEIAKAVVTKLRAKGVDAQLLVPEATDTSLTTRCKRVNNWCYKYGKSNVLLLSIHVNAAGMGNKWMSAGGWCCFTSKGETKSDAFAECLYDAAEKHLYDYIRNFPAKKAKGLYDSKQRPIRTDKVDGDRDFEANFAVLYNTLCPAVLTENLFQDNKADVEYLLSEEGKQHIIDLHVDGVMNYLQTLK
jgi:N-acetylmuramoyl-L-alanine amidase